MPPTSIRKLMNGYIYQLPLLKGGDPGLTPPVGKAWLILGGAAYHVTGTSSVLYVTWKDQASYTITEKLKDYVFDVPAGVASSFIPVFSTIVDVDGASNTRKQSLWTPIFVTNNDVLMFLGDASSTVNLKVIEFDE